jgi:two-component system, LuxR family, sensor kinase FixL
MMSESRSFLSRRADEQPAEIRPTGADLAVGPWLTVTFALLVTLILGGNGLLIWQFHLAREQADRLSDVSQQMMSALRLQAGVLLFHQRLSELVQAKDARILITQSQLSQAALFEQIQQTRKALTRSSPGTHIDPLLLPALEAIELSVSTHVQALDALADSGDWDAVQFRVADRQPIEVKAAELVKSVDQEFTAELSRSESKMKTVQSRILILVPASAISTFFIAMVFAWTIVRRIVALRLEERNLASLVENSTDLIGMASLQGKILFVNAAGQTIVGLTGKKQAPLARISDYIADQDRQRFENDVLPLVFKDGRWEGETLFRDFKTDASIPMWQHLFFVTEAKSGRRLALATICRDITERKRTQEFLQQAQADLARVNRVMVVGEMAASIAHEVNQPLTGIVAHAGTGLRWLAARPPDIEEARQALEFILRDGNRAAGVIARIRALMEKVPARTEPMDINAAVLEVIALTHAELRRNRVELRSQLASDLPLVPADRVQLQQVILNLIVNASEAMSGVGNLPRELVIASAAEHATEVLVEVRDSGPGFGLADPRRVFDSFYTTKPDGMGMGLSICRSIVEAHGGRLWALPNQPRGAIFRFTLPVDSNSTESAHD